MAERFELVEKAILKMVEDKKYATLRDILVTMNPSDIAGIFEDLYFFGRHFADFGSDDVNGGGEFLGELALPLDGIFHFLPGKFQIPFGLSMANASLRCHRTFDLHSRKHFVQPGRYCPGAGLYQCQRCRYLGNGTEALYFDVHWYCLPGTHCRGMLLQRPLFPKSL